jgi:hypothetical protein
MVLTMLQIIDTAIALTFYTIIAVAAVLVFGAFFWIIDTINRFHHWLRGKRYKSMFAAPPRRRKRKWCSRGDPRGAASQRSAQLS